MMAKPNIKGPSPIDIHVGSRLRNRRRMLGMSQEKLAHAFGLTFQQVQKYEKGKNRMGASRLQQAADILGVTVPFFFEGADDGPYKGALSSDIAGAEGFHSRKLMERLCKQPGVIPLLQQARLKQRFGEFLDEQRHAVGLGGDLLHH